MALGNPPVFRTTSIRKSGIYGMVAGMSRAVAIGLQGSDMALGRALAGRIIESCRARDHWCQLEQVFHFTHSGGALYGEVLTDSPRFYFDSDGTRPTSDTYWVVKAGGAIEVYSRTTHALIDEIPGSRIVKFRLPPKAWEGLKYTSETPKLDQYQTLARSLETQIGDCDDAAIMMATILKILGFIVGFKVVSTNGRSWTHVFLVAGFPRAKPTRWVALDTTHPSVAEVGWDPCDVMTLPNGGPLPAQLFIV